MEDNFSVLFTVTSLLGGVSAIKAALWLLLIHIASYTAECRKVEIEL